MANGAEVEGGLVEQYRLMARIRRFEQAVASSFRNGAVHGFVHLSVGQEAVAVGVCQALEKTDYITTTHRGHGHCIAKGADPEAMMAELFGRSTGICRGKGGSMHIADPSLGILGANGIVGAGIPLAVGAGLAARTRGSEQVVVAFFGDGAVHCGAFHEAMTLAVAWSVPAIFVCEDNRYAEFTHATRWPGPGLMERATSYGMPAVAVDGNDVAAVFDETQTVVNRVRAGEGPVFVLAETYRLHGHYEGDAEPYRREGEREEWEGRDPLARVRSALGKARADQLDRIDEAVAAEIDAAVEQAKGEPYPDASAVLEDVYG